MKISLKINIILILILFLYSAFFLLIICAYEFSKQNHKIDKTIDYHINKIIEESQVIISNMLLEQHEAIDIYFERIQKKDRTIISIFILSNNEFENQLKRNYLYRKKQDVFIEKNSNKFSLYHKLKFGNTEFGVINKNVMIESKGLFAISNYRKIILYLFSALFLQAFVLSFLIKQTTIKPLKQICKQLQPLKKGNYNIAFSEQRTEEFSFLKNSISSIIFELKDYQEEKIRHKIEKKTIEAKTKAKSRFLAHMSHEIRTPLNTIIGYCELLKRSKEIDNADYVDRIRSSGKLLLSLINDVLDFSKIEKGCIYLNLEPVFYASIVADLKYQYKKRFDDKGISFSMEFNDVLAKNVVLSDEVRIKQIFSNLLNNALKFTLSGFVKVSVHGNLKTPEKMDIMIKVSDSGVGIEDTNIIFQDFEQLPNIYVSERGFGLGLAIVKRLVELLNGSITVNSEKGKGSTFTVVLPDNNVIPDPKSNAYDDNEERIKFHSANLLAADDNEKNRELITDYFSNQPNINIFTAQNGNEALQLIYNVDIDIVLLDIKMPFLSGAEVAKIIKRDKRYSHIPIIVITADITIETRKELQEKNCDAYLLKPIGQKVLFTTLKDFLTYDVILNKCKSRNPINGDKLEIPGNFDKSLVSRVSTDLKQLKNVTWSNLDKTMIYGDISKFARDVQRIGNKYKFEALIKWGDKLNKYATDYNIAQTETTFAQFDDLISTLDNRY